MKLILSRLLIATPPLIFFFASDGGPNGPNDVGQLHDVLKEDTVGFQRVLAAVERCRADDIEYQIVGLSILGEVFPRVVDHRVGTQGLHQLDVRTAADPGHHRAEVFGQLHAGRADGPRSPDDRSSCPARIFPRSRRKYNAVFAPNGIATASSQLSESGLIATAPVSGRQAY